MRMQNTQKLIVLAAVLALCAPLMAGEMTPPQVKARTQMAPFYPATAAMSGAEANLVLVARVGADGKVRDAEVLGCDAPGVGFEQAAVDAVRQWRFRPAMQDGEAVVAETYVQLRIGAPLKGSVGAYSDTQTRIFRQNPLLQLPAPEGVASTQGVTYAIHGVERPPCGRLEVGCLYDRSKLNNDKGILVTHPRPEGEGNARSRLTSAAPRTSSRSSKQ